MKKGPCILEIAYPKHRIALAIFRMAYLRLNIGNAILSMAILSGMKLSSPA